MKNLLKKKEQFEIISSIAQEVIWDWDLVKDTMWWNASYYNNFGYQRTEGLIRVNTYIITRAKKQEMFFNKGREDEK